MKPQPMTYAATQLALRFYFDRRERLAEIKRLVALRKVNRPCC